MRRFLRPSMAVVLMPIILAACSSASDQSGAQPQQQAPSTTTISGEHVAANNVNTCNYKVPLNILDETGALLVTLSLDPVGYTSPPFNPGVEQELKYTECTYPYTATVPTRPAYYVEAPQNRGRPGSGSTRIAVNGGQPVVTAPKLYNATCCSQPGSTVQ